MAKARKRTKAQEHAFNQGSFWAIQTVFLDLGAPSMAETLLREGGFTREQALALSKETGYRMTEMDRLIRGALKKSKKPKKD